MAGDGIGNHARAVDPDWIPVAEHIYVDGLAGLAVARRQDPDEVLAIWMLGPENVMQTWVSAARVDPIRS